MGHWLIYENSEINGSQMACRSQVTIRRSRDIDHGHEPRYSGSTGWHYCTRRLVHGNGTALGTADNFLWTSEYAERHYTRKTFGVSTWGVMIDWTGEKGQIQDWNLPHQQNSTRFNFGGGCFSLGSLSFLSFFVLFLGTYRTSTYFCLL